MSLTLKITSLFVRTLAKPMANAIKRNAHEHERFRRICVGFAQKIHRVDMRMRLGLLQDPAVIDRQIKKEVAAAKAARDKHASPTVKTEAEMKAEEEMTEKERDEIKKRTEEKFKPRIRPLSEQKAIETGANFVSEAFIFAVGISVIVFEQWRQRRKAKNARDDIREDLEELQIELKTVKSELDELRKKQPDPVQQGKLLSFWRGSGVAEHQKTEEDHRAEAKVAVAKEKEMKRLREQAEAEKPAGRTMLNITQASNGAKAHPTTNDGEPQH
ncbi:hypothetical protein OPT61_g1497 [Boeremia exigua]|uniref:Uncharacterized protein n=1 Tax=Boeremia exigua TaxID=749465 RepID=A0ACC2IQ78_9PLEO|nr:hypothetical protein OPT61_g1497 [Boeremia exigua]